jgi:N-methylhydantoinase B
VRHGAGVRSSGGAPDVVAFVQAFGHHDDIGGAVPGLDAAARDQRLRGGLMVPADRLWDQGVPQPAALAIMTRNSRMPDSLAADLDAECSACLMGRAAGRAVRPLRRRRVEACFDAILDSTTATYRREILSQIPSVVDVGGLRRARRRRRAAAAHPADH